MRHGTEMSLPDPQNDTRTRILDLVEGLIMARGYNAISYQDVAGSIGIRKASIHHHFPAKADLGLAVIERYIAKLAVVAPPVEGLDEPELDHALESFLRMFVGVAQSGTSICLGGILGAEFQTLPEPIRLAVRRFYTAAASWLTALLERGRALGVYRFEAASAELADAILAMLEGALIIARVQGDPGQVTAPAAMVRRMIGKRS
jgi:TetR/AcrR family transcriptional repressor of nem operon